MIACYSNSLSVLKDKQIATIFNLWALSMNLCSIIFACICLIGLTDNHFHKLISAIAVVVFKNSNWSQIANFAYWFGKLPRVFIPFVIEIYSGIYLYSCRCLSTHFVFPCKILCYRPDAAQRRDYEVLHWD